MKCATYKLMLTRSTSAVSDKEREHLKDVLKNIPISDYFITIDQSPLNSVCRFITSITIIRRSIEEAKPIADLIENILTENGIYVRREETFLIWGESDKHFTSSLDEDKFH